MTEQQESLVILERVLTENTNHSEAVGGGTPSDGTPSFVMAAPGSSGSAASAVVSGAAGLLLRSAEAGGFVTGWPFVSGAPGSEVCEILTPSGPPPPFVFLACLRLVFFFLHETGVGGFCEM